MVGCTFSGNNTKCPESDNPCEEWVCVAPGLSPFVHGCVLKNKAAGTPCRTGRTCVVNGFCLGNHPLCFGTPIDAICERDELECSVDTCISDPADLDVDELGCRQSLLEGPCRPEDPCIVNDEVDTFCVPETFFCRGGAPLVCPRSGEHSVPICVGGSCFEEFVDVADDDVDLLFHFDDWYVDFFVWLTAYIFLALAGLTGFIMLMRSINRLRTGADRTVGSGRSIRSNGRESSLKSSNSSSSSKRRRMVKRDTEVSRMLL